MIEKLTRHYSKADGSKVEAPSESELGRLEEYFGQEAILFLKQKATLYKEVIPYFDKYTECKFLVIIEDRAVEIFLRTSGVVDLHFSPLQAYLDSDPEKYKKMYDKDEFGSSLKFLRFLDTFFSKVKKDIPLVVMGATGKRGRIFQERAKKIGLTDVIFINLLDD